MNPVHAKLSVFYLLVLMQAGLNAEETTPLTLDEAIQSAHQRKTHTDGDPFSILGFHDRLPAECLRADIVPLLKTAARSEQEQQTAIEVASRFFKIQDMENRLLARGEMVASTYGDWQRLLTKNEAKPDEHRTEQTMRAESIYLKALAAREELRMHLHQEYHFLANSIGDPARRPVERGTAAFSNAKHAAAQNKPQRRATQIALSALGKWWQNAPRKLSSLQPLCADRIKQVGHEDAIENDRQDDLLRSRISFLQRYAIPALESELELAEFQLDQARSNKPGAPRLGHAMTDSLLAGSAVQAMQNQLRLEQLRLNGNIEATSLPEKK